MSQKYKLFWEEFSPSLTAYFAKYRREGKFLDVTLTCDGGVVKAHQIILAAGSPYFEDMFLENRHECPIVHLRHVSVHDMRLILDFVYEGKVYLSLSELPNFIKSAEDLQIRGMLQSNATGAKASDTGHVVEELCETVTSLAVPISESIKNITKHCSPEKSMLQVEPDMVQVKNAPVDTVPISNDGDEHMGRRGRDGDDGKDDECFSSNEGMMRSYQMQEPLPHNSQQHLNFEAVVHKSRRESIAVMPSTPEERTFVDKRKRKMSVPPEFPSISTPFLEMNEQQSQPLPGTSFTMSNANNENPPDPARNRVAHSSRDIIATRRHLLETFESLSALYSRCKICSQTVKCIATHYVTHFPGTYICTMCPVIYKTRGSWTNHLKTKHQTDLISQSMATESVERNVRSVQWEQSL